MPLTLRIFSRTPGRKKLIDERVLDDERITVGRGQTCTVILEDPNRYLSRLHAEFERTTRGYLLRVLSKMAPVIVNGVSHFQGSEVTVHAGDTLVMLEYELEVVSVSVTKPPEASTSARRSGASAPPASPKRISGPVQVTVHSPDPGTGRRKWLARGIAAGVAAFAVAIVLALFWPTIEGFLPEGAEQKKAAQTIARLESEARSLLKLVDADRREIKGATAASRSEIGRVEGLVRSAHASQDRMALDAALGEARRMAKAAIGLEDKVRERVEGPAGLPKAEGTLGAAAAAAKAGDRAEAIRLLEATVASLARMRAGIAQDRKATQVELDKGRADLLTAETRAIALAEARARAEAQAKEKAKAKAKEQAEAALAREAEQVAQSAHSLASPCLGRLSGEWSHPLGGTWTFAGNQGTRVEMKSKYGSEARQITVMNLSSCANETMTYKFVRLALLDTEDPGKIYDRTEANAPRLSIWAKANTLRYAISSAGLRIGNYTYAKR